MHWTPGHTLKSRPYRIESILGQGGFGITYKAQHLQLHHYVVIKTPNASLKNDREYPKFVQRFIKEGRVLAQLSQSAHPSIVRVSDLFEEDDVHCLVMDLVPGKSLYDLVQQRQKLPETEAVAIIRQIGEALEFVHQKGIVHRDAHPGNIIISSHQKAVLIDFGIATELMPTVESSKHPFKPAFAPWEQMMNGSGNPTVDIYALAASLYYAVTGEIPTPSLQRQLQNVPLAPIRGVSQKVAEAIEKGMASDPVKRPQSMAEWLGYLQTIPPTVPSVLPPGNEVELTSERGVDYSRLRDLLKAGKWQEADQETLKVMLKASRREQQGWLEIKDIDNFPYPDLRTIDQLWVKYSQGHFGFSVQKEIYQRLGGTRDYNRKIWEAFGNKVGWRVKGRWKRSYYNLASKKGHLPDGIYIVSGWPRFWLFLFSNKEETWLYWLLGWCVVYGCVWFMYLVLNIMGATYVGQNIFGLRSYDVEKIEKITRIFSIIIPLLKVLFLGGCGTFVLRINLSLRREERLLQSLLSRRDL